MAKAMFFGSENIFQHLPSSSAALRPLRFGEFTPCNGTIWKVQVQGGYVDEKYHEKSTKLTEPTP